MHIAKNYLRNDGNRTGLVAIIAIMALCAVGCPNYPCMDNRDEDCKSDVTGLVCNMSITFLLPSIGTCQYPGVLDDPCDETPDCASGYTCQWELEACKVSFGHGCSQNEDCYDYRPKAGPNTCINSICTKIGFYGDVCDDDQDCWGSLRCHPYTRTCV